MAYPKAQGKEEFLRFQKGERLTMKQALLAHCYDCTGHYTDGRKDCEMQTCPFHPFMPYNRDRVRRVLTDEQRNQVRDRFKNAVLCRGAR
jgi:hypothetical protein